MSKPPSAVVLRKKEPEWPGKKPQENCLRQIFLEKLTGHGWEKTFATVFPVWSLSFLLTHLFPIHLRFADVFRWWRKGTLETNGLKLIV